MGTLSYAVKPGGLSEQDHERIVALAEKGVKSSAIARKLEKHPATVRWFLYRLGLVQPTRRHSIPVDRPNGSGRKGYGPDEDRFILGLREAGVDLREIAQRVTEQFGHPRSRHGVEVRLIMLAALDDVASLDREAC
ncbi:hypothetical protein [uncultured Methylobacterium sp.]|uniref:hypothetical protein n=1 Tax=uncultured Methylobacterium sp. TaxID=157278 RepID=UPI0035CB6C85